MNANMGRAAEVLLVEDSPGDVRLTREALKEGKVRNNLSVVNDGVEAMEFLRRQGKYADAPRPDIVLLDLNMPRKDGREVLAEMKGDDDLKRIPVVILTSSRQDRDVNAAYDIGVNSYLVKPVEFDGLLQMLKTVNLYWLMLNERPRFNGR